MKRFNFYCLLLILMGLTIPGFAQTAADYLAAGKQSYTIKDYTKGAQYYKAATQMDPNSAEAYQGLGNCEYMLGHNSAALEAYEKAVNLNPGNTQLANFLQGLRAKVAQATATGGNTSDNSGADTAASNETSSETPPIETVVKKKKWDINFKFGTVVAGSEGYNSGVGIGLGPAFGGGVEGYFLIGGHFGIGLIGQFYSGYNVGYFGYSSNTISNFEIMTGLKYIFGDSSFKPYVLGSVGYSFLSVVSNVPSVDISGPVVQFGGGVEYSFGATKTVGIFLQTKFSMAFVTSQYSVSTSSFSGVPIETGLNLSF